MCRRNVLNVPRLTFFYITFDLNLGGWKAKTFYFSNQLNKISLPLLQLTMTITIWECFD